MEEAREIDRRQALRERYGVTRPSPVDPQAHAPSPSASRSFGARWTSWSSSLLSGLVPTRIARRPRAPSRQPVKEVRGDGFAHALHAHRRHRLDDRARPELAEGRLADQDTVHRRRRLQTRCEIDDVADDAVLAMARRCADEPACTSPLETPTRNRGQSSCSAAVRCATRWSTSAARAARNAWSETLASLPKMTMSSSPTIWCTSPPARSISGMSARSTR